MATTGMNCIVVGGGETPPLMVFGTNSNNLYLQNVDTGTRSTGSNSLTLDGYTIERGQGSANVYFTAPTDGTVYFIYTKTSTPITANTRTYIGDGYNDAWYQIGVFY